MFKRPLFWLGLLLSGLSSFKSLKRRFTHPQTAFPAWLSNLAPDAVMVCDAAGKILHLNPAAQELSALVGADLEQLCYPSGQRVPQGQLPLNRVLRTGKNLAGEEYRGAAADGSMCILDVSAWSLPTGGAAAVFRNTTALHESLAREAQAEAHRLAVQSLCRGLGKAETGEQIGQVVVAEARALLNGLPDTQVRLYVCDAPAESLTCIASDPEDRPKRPRSAAQAQPRVFRFDVTVPALWQLYVSRQPCFSAAPADDAAAAYALPLVAGGATVGHLTLSSGTAGAFDDPGVQSTLLVFASLAALALAVPQATERAVAFEAQTDAVRQMAQAIAAGTEPGRMADLIRSQVRQIVGGEVCTLSIAAGGELRAVGTFADDLLFPERTKANAAALHGQVVQKAWRTHKTVTQSGIANPSFEAGPWRAFAGKSGQHSVVAVPLAAGQGVLAVYTDGGAALPEAQIKFLETVSALVSLSIPRANAPAASADL